jgi:hypothetical protein
MPASKRAVVYLRASTRRGKKWMVRIVEPATRKGGKPRVRTVHFGAAGMSDFTKHKDPERKDRYVTRHRRREDWTRAGLATAGFWSRWLLWNRRTLAASKRDIARRFRVTFRSGWPA